jgi:hypothetical protein
MKRFAFIATLVFAASLFLVLLTAFAQGVTASWAYFTEVTPAANAPGLYDLSVPLDVMDKARPDLADLRLLDAQGKEIPYGLRIRSEIDDRQEVGGTLFNQVNVGSATEVSVDLGENPGEHNEVEIETSGTNFRRRVTVEGGDDGKDWKILENGAVLFDFQSQNKTVQSDRVSYPVSRYRYLRVRVFADELADKQPPLITNVNAVRVVKVNGELATWNVNLPSRQLLRSQGVPSSAWNIDLGGRAPCDRLILHIEDTSFSRTFQVEARDDPQNVRLVASGELTRRVGETWQPTVIAFDQEEHVRRLRLLINDYSNPILTLSQIDAAAPARQMVFELKETPAQPVHLFFGNPNATAPHYDFEKELPAKLSMTPVRLGVKPASNNPEYKPAPLPLTERVPWAIYIVLAISSIALGLILFRLARSTVPVDDHPDDAETRPV